MELAFAHDMEFAIQRLNEQKKVLVEADAATAGPQRYSVITCKALLVDIKTFADFHTDCMPRLWILQLT